MHPPTFLILRCSTKSSLDGRGDGCRLDPGPAYIALIGRRGLQSAERRQPDGNFTQR